MTLNPWAYRCYAPNGCSPFDPVSRNGNSNNGVFFIYYSGSANQAAWNDANYVAMFTQDVDLTATRGVGTNVAYYLGVYARSSATSPDGLVSLTVDFYSSSGGLLTTSGTNRQAGDWFSLTNGWTLYRNESICVPSGAMSARIILRAKRESPQATRVLLAVDDFDFRAIELNSGSCTGFLTAPVNLCDNPKINTCGTGTVCQPTADNGWFECVIPSPTIFPSPPAAPPSPVDPPSPTYPSPVAAIPSPPALPPPPPPPVVSPSAITQVPSPANVPPNQPPPSSPSTASPQANFASPSTPVLVSPTQTQSPPSPVVDTPTSASEPEPDPPKETNQGFSIGGLESGASIGILVAIIIVVILIVVGGVVGFIMFKKKKDEKSGDEFFMKASS